MIDLTVQELAITNVALQIYAAELEKKDLRRVSDQERTLHSIATRVAESAQSKVSAELTKASARQSNG